LGCALGHVNQAEQARMRQMRSDLFRI